MKTIIYRIMALAATTAALATARADLFDYESFNYSGTALNGQNGNTGWSGAWFTTSSTDNVLSDDGVSLSYPMTVQAPLTMPSSSGSRTQTGGLGANASTSRLLSQTINLGVDGTVRYASALFRKTRPNGEVSNDNILIEFVDTPGNRRWGFGIEGGVDKPWLNANGSTNTTWSGGPAVTVGDTYFIVAKIVSSAAGLDTAYLKVYGTGYGSEFPVAEPTTWDAVLTETTSAVLDRLRIRIDTGNDASHPGEVDDVRVGSSWTNMVSVLIPPGPDTNPPVVLTVDSLLTNVINVIFSEPVSQATAENTGNYTITNGPISSITLRPGGTNVEITVDSIIAAGYTVAVSNVQDIAGNTLAGTNLAGIPHGWQKSQSISLPLNMGMAFALNDKIVIYADGANVSGTEDHFHYVYNTISGDFDLSVRVESLFRANNNSRAGLMARMDTFFDSPNVLIEATPDRFIFQYRTNSGGSTLAFGTDGNPATRPPTSFPNSWVRLKRSGAVFTGYCSTNYPFWYEIASFDSAVGDVQYPADILVGLVASAGNANLVTRAQFSAFGTAAVLVTPTLSIAPSGSNLEVSWGTNSIGFMLQASPVLVPVNWTNVPGSFTTNRAFLPASAAPLFFRAIFPPPSP